MSIAVIIPAFNAAAWLRDCVFSLLAQSLPDWYAIIVDDGSTDDTALIAAGFGDERIRLVRQSSAGVSAARNRGMAEAMRDGPDAMLFLDADDWLAPDALARLSQLLDASPWAVAAAGGYARIGPGGSARSVPPPSSGCLLPRLLTRNLFVNGGQLLIRREAIEQAGSFQEDLAFGEDWEYWTRLALLGEFVSLRKAPAVMFVRERDGSTYHTMATDARRQATVLAAIYANPAFAHRLGAQFVRELRYRAEAETAWTIGRELIRHGRSRDGREWLGRSLRGAPNPKRLALLALSWFRAGPFRPYGVAG